MSIEHAARIIEAELTYKMHLQRIQHTLPRNDDLLGLLLNG